MSHEHSVFRLVNDSADHDELLPDALAELGRLLALLHAVPVDVVTVVPPAVVRLRSWMRSGPAARQVRDRLGPSRWSALESWACTAPVSSVQSHGLAGLGQCAFTRSGAIEAVLGEDLGRASPEHDLGCVAGQLVELGAFAPGPRARLDPSLLLEVFLTGYGGPVDSVALHRATALAVTRHIADFSSYVGENVSEVRVWADLVASLVDRALADDE